MKDLFIKIHFMINKLLTCFLIFLFVSYSTSASAAISTVAAEQSGTTASGLVGHIGSGALASRNSCGNITPSIPAGSVGDLLIAVALVRETNATVTMAGWTQYYTENHGVGGNQDLEGYIFYRVATGGDPNTITSGGAGNCRSLIGRISRFSGVDTTAPFETDPILAGNSSTQNTTTVSTGTETTTTATALSIAVTFINDNAVVTEADSFTESFESVSTLGRDSAISLNYRQETVAGAKGAFTWAKNSGTDESMGVLFALTPDPTSEAITINVPTGTTTDDVMVAAISVRPFSITVTPPTGWTLLIRTDQATNSNSQAIYYRVATSSEPSAYIWTFGGGTITGTAGGIVTYRGVDTSSPIDAFAGNVTPNGTSHTANSINTTVANAMVISTHSFRSAETWAPPAGMTEEVDIASLATPNAAGIALEMNDVLQASIGATGNKTATVAGNADTGVAHLVALTPIVVSGGITVTLSGNVDNINAGSISITGASIGDPEATNTSTETVDNVNSITTTITTLTNNAWLIDTVGDGQPDSFTPGAGQTERWDESADSSTGAMSTKAVVTAALDSMTQNFNAPPGSNRLAHAVIAVAPASSSTIAFGAVASANTGAATTSTLNWTHTLVTSETVNTKLIVGISIEEPSGCSTGRVSSVTFGNIPLIQATTILVDDTYCHQVEIWYVDLTNIIVSTNNNSTLGGQAIDQDEAVEYNGLNDTGTLFIDDATFAANERLVGIHQYTNGNLAISTAGNANIGGNNFGDDDIVEVTPSGTAGVYNFVQILFDGGINFSNTNEDVDAVYVRDNGNIILSTIGPAQLSQCGGGNLNFNDDDLVEWDVGSSCATMFLDESATGNLIPNAGGDEDIDGVHLLNDDSNLISFSLTRNNTIRGTAVLDGDVILYNRNTDTASIYFSESNFTSGGEDIDALTLAIPPVSTVTVDHYAISYPLGTPGVTCEAQAVRITAHGDATDHSVTVAPSSSTTITLTTTPAADGWTLKSGNGTFTAPNQYTFDGTETFVEFWLTETTATSAPHIDIDVTDGTTTDLDGVLEDDNIEFADAVFRFFNGGGVGENIGTQIAGKESDIMPGAQTLQLRSVITNTSTMACEARILNLQTIEMAYKCNNPTTCEATPIPTRVQVANIVPTNFDITPGNDNATTVDASNGSYDPVDLNFGVSGTATFSFDFNDVGQIQFFAREVLVASLPDPAITVFGASNMFVVRPFGFDIDSGGLRAADWLDNNALDDSTGTNLSYAADADGSVFASAGNNTNTFPVTLNAVIWQSADDSDNDGVPDSGVNLTDNSTTLNFGQETANSELVDVTSGNVQPTSVGSLFFGNNLDFVNGTITTNLAFNEVGIMDLSAALTTSDYLSGGANVTATHQRFGRFIPDRFTLTNNNPVLENSCVAGSFTYMEESFYYGAGNEPAITVTAVNEAGGTTVNYGDGGTSATDYWKLSTTLTRTYNDNSVNNGTTFSDLTAASVIVTGDNNYDGIGIFTLSNTVLDRDSFMFDRASVDLNAAEGAPFTASIDLLIQVTAGSLTDTDGVCYDGDGDGTCETDGSDDYTALTDTGGTALPLNQLRFGRFTIGTAVGSELLTLTPLLMTEYFDGTGFVLNTNDSCTAIDLADHIRLENTGTLVAGNTAMAIGGGTASITTFNNPLVSGNTGTVFSAPGVGNTGFVNISGNLACNDVTVACVGTTTFDHLRYDWDDLDGNDDGPYDDEPSGRIDFGLFEGFGNYIYIREPW
jgi:uncharacterized protein DUF6701